MYKLSKNSQKHEHLNFLHLTPHTPKKLTMNPNLIIVHDQNAQPGPLKLRYLGD